MWPGALGDGLNMGKVLRSCRDYGYHFKEMVESGIKVQNRLLG